MTDVRFNEDQPDVYDYTLPAENDPDSSFPIELDASPVAPPAISTDKGGSLADRFRQDFGNRVVPTIDVPVPGREGWVLRFRLDWSEAKTQKWRKQAKDNKSENGISNQKLATALIADQCTAILLDEKPIVLDGEQWTFQSKALQAMFEVHTPQQAVQRVIPIFAQLTAVADAVYEAAGKGDSSDPTTPA